MSINPNNFIPLVGELKTNQRAIKIDGKVIPVGIGGNYIPGSGWFDVEGVNVTADKILAGVVAVNADKEKITGNIETVTPTLNKNVFSISAGYVAEDTALEIPEVFPEFNGRTLFVETGYIEAAEISAPQASVSVTAEEITISSGYIDAVQIPRSEFGCIDGYGQVQKLDLSGETPTAVGIPTAIDTFYFDIAETLPVMQGAIQLYRCETVDPAAKTWQGRKYYGNPEDGWKLSEDIISLSCLCLPTPGEVYNANATLHISQFYYGCTADQLLLYGASEGSLGSLFSGEYLRKRFTDIPALAAIIGDYTPLLVSPYESGAQFYAGQYNEETRASVQTAFEYNGTQYYYGIFDNDSILIGKRENCPHFPEMEAADAAKLLLDQFFWLGGTFDFEW